MKKGKIFTNCLFWNMDIVRYSIFRKLLFRW